MTGQPGAASYDVAGLARQLRGELRGDVHDDPGGRARYTMDASNYRVPPDLVVVPRTTDDVVVTLELARRAGAPVVARGGGTSMAGNVLGGVVVDHSRHLDRIVAIDPAARTAVVQPGVVLTHLTAAAARHGLTFGVDPSSQSRATLGGMIGNNACGAHSVAWGTTQDNVLGLDVVTGAGDRVALGDQPVEGTHDTAARDRLLAELGALGREHRLLVERRFGTFSRQISGYPLQHLRSRPDGTPDLPRLLTGTEGTLATTLGATLRLVERPAATVLLVLGFPDAVAAAEGAQALLPHDPLTVESVNAQHVDRLPAHVRDDAVAAGIPDGRLWLLVEAGAEDPGSARAAAATMADAVRDRDGRATAAVVTEPGAVAVLWRVRRDSAGLAGQGPDGSRAYGGWEDAAVPPERLGTYLTELDVLLERHGLTGASYGHFGDGCMHTRIDFDLATAPGVAAYRRFVEQATDLVVRLGGSVSGEHGDGRARGELAARMYGADAVAVFGEVKRIFDPDGALNPGVIVDPAPLDADLRLRGRAPSWRGATTFSYADDGGDFAAAQARCVGIGKCRQSSGGVMCPSYQVTHEEEHSTRGRARLLWEMLEGDLIDDGWRSPQVRDALDLCLSCKGCLSDCPTGVDMATYKAEFTAQHYRGRPWARPRSHWSMGWLPTVARLASRAPGPANRLAGSRLGAALARAGGVDASRSVPAFADTTFRSWYAARTTGAAPASGPEVVLWPDTFTDHFAPEAGRAAVAVLEDAGLRPMLPEDGVCCGLTWVSTGQLGRARRVLRRTLRLLEPLLDRGLPIVVLEPSCAAALRHDLPGLLADDPLAHAVSRSVRTFAGALRELAPDWVPPRLDADALVQTHCHQHAVLGTDADRSLLTAAGVRAEFPDAGCCGLAGNFGFETGHADISRRIGERVLLPAVRAAPEGTVVLADGFSCRTQIAAETPRRARHLAELLADALPPPPAR